MESLEQMQARHARGNAALARMWGWVMWMFVALVAMLATSLAMGVAVWFRSVPWAFGLLGASGFFLAVEIWCGVMSVVWGVRVTRVTKEMP